MGLWIAALLLVENDSSRTLLLLGLGLLGIHHLLEPVIRGRDVGFVGLRVAALDIGLLAVDQVQVGHGIVVVLAQLERLVEVVEALLNQPLVLLLHLLADLLVLEGLIAGGGLTGGRHGIDAILVGLRPVDDGDRVVLLRIAGVDLDHLGVVLLGLVEVLDLVLRFGGP